MDAITHPPLPVNEPARSYAPGSDHRVNLTAALKTMAAEQVELPMRIGGVRRMAGGTPFEVRAPHQHDLLLGRSAQATDADVADAVAAALAAAPGWQQMSFDDRAAVFLRAADLISTTWRDRLNAATMLGQSKSAQQAEIDSACELADFLRFNVHFARQLIEEQPLSPPLTWNRLDYRPLEGFVLAITPFNFTAIAGNLPSAPALLGNVVVWKPSPTQQLAADVTMAIFEAAGLPAGVINLVTGDGESVSRVAVGHPALAGIHFTGSTGTFRSLWRAVGDALDGYQGYPRLVGETGGKDFVLAHPSADPTELVTALARGAFEYQGQKCSAASRAYLPRSLWTAGLRDELIATTESLTFGDVADLHNFGGAVIDRRAFDRLSGVLGRAAADDTVKVVAGGTADDAVGYFIRPTIVECADPGAEYFRQEYFGPILAVHVYEDAAWPELLGQVDEVSSYALTGAVFGRDRAALVEASAALRFAAGNIYLNDKPTGAVVGQQPFGGARLSGTNDKAGSVFNLMRWISPRTIKETFVGATDVRYPHMD
jgi:1-pyrroline-5-carboxylate dehydrogenase